MGTSTSAPEDRFCDIVMKGGIASGIVYPLAVADLAEKYRFRSIGGTSAGAVAAVVTAAAELQRRETGSMAGFDILRKVPDDLRKELGEGERGIKRLWRTATDMGERRLKYLFQPQPGGCTRLFHVLVRALNRRSAMTHAMGALLGFIEAYWVAAAAGMALGVASFLWYLDPAGPVRAAIAGVLIAAVAIVAGIAYWVYRDLTGDVVANGYGVCRGPGNDAGHNAITPWMNELIQTAAGRSADGDPVTFGDLWKAPGFPPTELGPMPEETRSIDLTIFTTNLAHGRPYLFPHSDDRARLFFKPEELEPYLPRNVMDWMLHHAAPYLPHDHYGDPAPQELERLGLRQIPEAKAFPIFLAARMSHSFPLLFSAVPLYAIDYEQPVGKRSFKRCWFSDGGLASNFPMHLFDGFLPAWPTFGLDLQDVAPGGSKAVRLPVHYLEGSGDRWDRFDEGPTSSARLGAFLISVFSTAQNWNDNTNARMPAVRDRVARVPLGDDEGGFNLNMPASVQKSVAERGQEAANMLIARFSPAADGAPGAGWDQQRWERFDVLLRTLSKRMPSVELALRDRLPDTSSYASLASRAASTAMPGHHEPFTPEEVTAINTLIALMRETARQILAHTSVYSPVPIPDPELRVRPPL
jgi:predicted acylesterase/phospholipase RssA